ncbi:MAG: hypothetical protein COV44_00780 [Deltaproteobacteria bacterium CG11_big_fil_rev_8_21_14_0_20_45_16]|nr:MAG: hypothetical protein COV44_00780 [Deltaproteobacteria bacterium CG11_big_fil_rev_8_21_14_0_20_45_16]
MRILILADPITNLKLATDTSLYLMRQFIAENHIVDWAEPKQLSWLGDRLVVESNCIEEPGGHEVGPKLEAAKFRELSGYELVLIRKDPPFDVSYQRLCWLLSSYEGRLEISNSPSLLLQHHEKMLPLTAVSQGILSPNDIISTCITDDASVARRFVRSLHSANIIMKPWLGHGGRDIQLLDAQGFVDEADKYFQTGERWMLQPFEDAVFTRGDRRVLFLGGKYLGDFVRLPRSGQFISNLIRGGQAFIREMDAQEKELVRRLEPWLANLGLDFVGADFINGKLTEINVTSPTGFRNYEDLTSKNLASWVTEYLTKKVARKLA